MNKLSKNNMLEEKRVAVAKLKYLHIAPRKVRLVADNIKGKHIVEAESQLVYSPHRVAKALLKLLRSAINNAVNKKLDKDKLYINSIVVNQGPMLKRWLPRAMGRATPIQKKMSHINIILEEKGPYGRYKIPQAKITKSEKALVKEKKEETKTREIKKKPILKVDESKKKSQGGFVKKIFRRKEIA